LLVTANNSNDGKGEVRARTTKKEFPTIFALSVGRKLPDTALQNKPGTP